MSQSKRGMVFFDGELHRAIVCKAEAMDRSISRVVNKAVRLALAEDAEDLKAFKSRANEPNLDFDNVVQFLRRRRKL